MPVVTFVPRDKNIEDFLAAQMNALRKSVKQVICSISGFPDSDVLVSLAACPYRDADPSSAEFILFVDTCPHEFLEAHSNELRNSLAEALIKEGLSFNNGGELWIRFLRGPWGLIREGKLIDTVDHPRNPSS